MKLRITPAQLSALSPAAASALQTYAMHKHMLGSALRLPLLTIGDMIELLADLQPRDEVYHYIDEDRYDIVLGTDTKRTNTFDLGWRGDLCDALWARVQEVLEDSDAPEG